VQKGARVGAKHMQRPQIRHAHRGIVTFDDRVKAALPGDVDLFTGTHRTIRHRVSVKGLARSDRSLEGKTLTTAAGIARHGIAEYKAATRQPGLMVEDGAGKVDRALAVQIDFKAFVGHHGVALF
jgi:hypothetical protein